MTSCIMIMIYLFFTISTFYAVYARSSLGCILRTNNKIITSKMPLAYTVNENNKAKILYPDVREQLILAYNRSFVLSCTTSYLMLNELNKAKEITVTCEGGVRLRYEGKIYQYADFECKHIPRSTLKVTKRVCQPNNNTVVTVGFQTKVRYFVLYSVCFDMKQKSTLYAWFNLRIPYYNQYQFRSKIRTFDQVEELFGGINMGVMYSKFIQTETVNDILGLPQSSSKYIDDDTYYITRGQYAAKTDFYFAREQGATFNYVNVAPQWVQFNALWNEVEMGVRNDMVMRSHARRVIVTGGYGTCTLPDEHNIQRPLFLVMPEKLVPVPMFMWKLIYDSDDEHNSVVYIGLNNPHVDRNVSEAAKVKCVPRSCPARIKDFKIQIIYCCTRESFERAYVGKFTSEVLRVPAPHQVTI